MQVKERWNQSVLEEINPEYSLEGLTVKLKFQASLHAAGLHFVFKIMNLKAWEEVTLFPPGFEPGTFRVLGERDNHYTTETTWATVPSDIFKNCMFEHTWPSNFQKKRTLET